MFRNINGVAVIHSMKHVFCILMAAVLCFTACACGADNGYGVRAIETLVEQDYSILFRNEDPIYFYVTAAIQVLAAEGKVDELSQKWLGGRNVEFDADLNALDIYAVPKDKTFIIGVDINSFPFVYISNGTFWGYDIELAQAVTDKLGWTLKAQAIEKENVYQELYSGNVDCIWGGVAVDQKDVDKGLFVQFGPYIHNDIVIAGRDSSTISGKSGLKGKTLAMPSTPEALDALKSNGNAIDRLGNVLRLVGGTTECFTYLYSGQCDVILTDTTAIQYYNCH